MGTCCAASHSRRASFSKSPLSAPPSVCSQPKSKLIQSLFIYRESIKLVQDAERPNRYFLDFLYTADSDCKITAFWFVSETSGEGYKKVRFVQQPGAQNPVVFLVSPGVKKTFPEKKLSIDVSVYADTLLKSSDKGTYPLVLEMCANEFKSEFQMQWSYLAFYQEGEVWKVRVLQQKLQVNEQFLCLLEVFGAEREEGHKDCVVCMTAEKGVMVVPCRHLCLCLTCAEAFPKQATRKCPICRCDVENLIQVR